MSETKHTPKQALKILIDELVNSQAFSYGTRKKIREIMQPILIRTTLEEQAVQSYEIPKTEQEKRTEKSESFNSEVRKLWADTFTAYTRSSNAVQRTSAKNWADEAVEEFKKRFTPITI